MTHHSTVSRFYRLVTGLSFLFFYTWSSAQSWSPVTGNDSPNLGGMSWTSPFGSSSLLFSPIGYAGLYKSTDTGATWSPNNEGIEGRYLPWFVSDGNRFYLLSRGHGIYVSSNNGTSFQKIPGIGLESTDFGTIGMIGSRLLLGMRECSNGCGIYYSDDQGITWTKSSGIPSTVWINNIQGGTLASTSAGIYKSTDNGVTWNLLNISGLPSMVSTPGGPSGPHVRRINYNNTPAGPVYLASIASGGGVYKSTDGVNWRASNNGLPTSAPAFYANCIYAADTTSWSCYATVDGEGIYKSTDYGETWSLTKSAGVPAAFNTVNTSNTTYLFETSRGGIYKVTNNGSVFTKSAGQPLGMIYNFAIDSNDKVYAYTADGVYSKVNDTWVWLPGLPITVNNAGASNVLARGTKIFAGTDNRGVYRLNTSSGTAVWEAMNTGLPAMLFNTNAQIRSNSAVTDAYYLGLYGAGFYYWDGISNTWTARNAGLTGKSLFVRSMQANGAFVVNSTEGGLYVSSDSGMTWTLTGPKDSSGTYLRTGFVAIDSTRNNTLYVSVDGLDAVGNALPSSGIWKSTNSGVTWSQVSAFRGYKTGAISMINLEGYSAVAISTVDETDAKSGVYFSTDGGDTWTAVKTGLNTKYLGEVSTSAAGDQMYLATKEGLYTFTQGSDYKIKLSSGWNLLGNSWNVSVNVGTLMGVTSCGTNVSSGITSVWKWNPTNRAWQFYTPKLADCGASYAAQKGYEYLTTINSGEGFWVNASQNGAMYSPMGAEVVYCSGFSKMPSGWNLIATGDNKYARAFNNCLSSTAPSVDQVANNQSITSMWAWDTTLAQWYFYSPLLDNNGTLSSYVTGKNYLDFGSRTLSPGSGFWVNKP
jgi:BNR/Asp-box repeat